MDYTAFSFYTPLEGSSCTVKTMLSLASRDHVAFKTKYSAQFASYDSFRYQL
jgi:hypothetical protein